MDLREVYETYHQANEQHNQQELLQHSLQQQQINRSRQEQTVPFPIYQSPNLDKSTINNRSPAFQIYQSPRVNRGLKNKSVMKSPNSDLNSSNEPFLDDLFKSTCDREEVSFLPTANISKFVIHQSSSLGLQPQIQPKGSAMKTPFR